MLEPWISTDNEPVFICKSLSWIESRGSPTEARKLKAIFLEEEIRTFLDFPSSNGLGNYYLDCIFVCALIATFDFQDLDLSRFRIFLSFSLCVWGCAARSPV